MGFGIEAPLKTYTYPSKYDDSLKVDKSRRQIFWGSVSLDSSEKEELGVVFKHYRSSLRENLTFYEDDNVPETEKYKNSYSEDYFSIYAAPIISSIRTRAFLGLSFSNAYKEETWGDGEKEETRIKGDSIFYGYQYDLDSNRKGSLIRLYLIDSDYNFNYKRSNDIKNIEFKKLKLFLKKKIKGHKNTWITLSYSLDRDESDNWGLSSSFRSKWMVFSLWYKQKTINHPDYDTEKKVGTSLTFYFGNEIAKLIP